jgi:hypothetical protein
VSVCVCVLCVCVCGSTPKKVFMVMAAVYIKKCRNSEISISDTATNSYQVVSEHRDFGMPIEEQQAVEAIQLNDQSIRQRVRVEAFADLVFASIVVMVLGSIAYTVSEIQHDWAKIVSYYLGCWNSYISVEPRGCFAVGLFRCISLDLRSLQRHHSRHLISWRKCV